MKTLPIMIVEDSDDDYEATERALKRDGRLRNRLIRFENGEDAVDYLYRQGDHVDPAASPRPGLILMDLNLPGAGGAKALARIKEDPELRKIPVIVLTTSSDPADVQRCYDAGANTYIVKPVGLEEFFTAIQELKNYWFEIAVLPGGG